MEKITEILEFIVKNKYISNEMLEKYIKIRNHYEEKYVILTEKYNYLKQSDTYDIDKYLKQMKMLSKKRREIDKFIHFADILYDIIILHKKKETCNNIKERLNFCESR